MFKTNSNKKRNFDRFIRHRSPNDFFNLNEQSDSTNIENYQRRQQEVNDRLRAIQDIPYCEFFNLSKMQFHQKNYETLLKSVLFPQESKKASGMSESSRTFVWPVKPRSKPCIGPPALILDMPHLDTNVLHYVADWSSKNCLATIFNAEVHMWQPGFEQSRTMTLTEKCVQNCLKWSGDGTLLAVGLAIDKIGIFDIEHQKIRGDLRCCRYCRLYALEWINSDTLLTGCSSGVLKALDQNLTLLRFLQLPSDHAIVAIKASCHKNRIALRVLIGTVIIVSFPKLEILQKIKLPEDRMHLVRAFDWHPWRNSLLVVCTLVDADQEAVLLWNVNKNTKTTVYTAEKHRYITAVSFNPISAELVVALDTNDVGSINVISNKNKIVEQLFIHGGPLLYLLWNNDGTTLASVGTDENMCLWNFFESSEEKKIQSKHQQQTKKVDVFEVFRARIR